ncbi:putative ABC transporter type IV [Anaerobacterium chartisolvens]|uniref:Putative ABC transporter type IV n=1 Tax=Anaerobacterium chartisolvens TaxID=1297424 RepID=A0A369B4E4_9FIRM|nr:putative ABC transporter permease [Anaerobacterium chartisolvens]RCX16389.1 putative ABC transporter type IV [Anaerobacterium chartisolvens]
MNNNSLSYLRLTNLLLYFIIYSFIGWCIETVYLSLSKGHFVSRGFLIGPFCCIYGLAAVFLIKLLKHFKHNIFLVFTGASVIATSLEYIAGVLMRLLFNIVLWDYSHELFNVHGFICLRASITWGIMSVITLYFIHPFIRLAVSSVPLSLKSFILPILAFSLIFNIIVSSAYAWGISMDLGHLEWISIKLKSMAGF